MALYGYFLLLYQVMVRRIDNVGKTVWTFIEGDSHGTSGQTSYSIGFAIAQVGKTGLKCNTCGVCSLEIGCILGLGCGRSKVTL